MFNVRHSEKDKLKGGLSVKKIGWVPEIGGSGEVKPYTVCLLEFGGAVCKGFYFLLQRTRELPGREAGLA